MTNWIYLNENEDDGDWYGADQIIKFGKVRKSQAPTMSHKAYVRLTDGSTDYVIETEDQIGQALQQAAEMVRRRLLQLQMEELEAQQKKLSEGL